mgnify:CR=1 FL=1
MKKKLQNLYLLLIVIFLYAPIMTLMVLSFNSSRTRAKWGGFTGKWYVSLFQDEAIMSTLYNTLIIALLSALIANRDWNFGFHWNPEYEPQVSYLYAGCHQHSDAERRHCDWCIYDAVVYRIPYEHGIFDNPDCTYNL